MSNPSLLRVLRKRDPKTHVRAASFTSNNVPWRTASYLLITLWCSQALPSRRMVARRLTTVHCPWLRPLRRCRARPSCWLPLLILKHPNVSSRPSRRVSIAFLNLFPYFLVFGGSDRRVLGGVQFIQIWAARMPHMRRETSLRCPGAKRGSFTGLNVSGILGPCAGLRLASDG